MGLSCIPVVARPRLQHAEVDLWQALLRPPVLR
jgi:hypothetical protein